MDSVAFLISACKTLQVRRTVGDVNSPTSVMQYSLHIPQTLYAVALIELN